jgi:hypothetical protein
MPFNIQCFRLIIITILQKKKKTLLKNDISNTNLSGLKFKELKKNEKNRFLFLKNLISTELHLKIYFLVMIIQLIVLCGYSFIFSDIILIKTGCPVHLIVIRKYS